ncbi:MAG: N-acetyltransferase [Candidatus Thiodiazotropha sp.]
MIHRILDKSKQQKVAELFTSAFTVSEGEKEGKLIGDLSSQLASKIDNNEIICFGTFENETLIGCIFFSRLHFSERIRMYLLAPVAVSADHQGVGFGQSLINYGLNELKRRRVDVVVTYGDPAFYSKVGFQALSETVIQAPLELSMPFGWLGQSLTGKRIPSIHGRPTCVDAFNDPVYW